MVKVSAKPINNPQSNIANPQCSVTSSQDLACKGKRQVIFIGATCMAEIDGQFFLLVEIKIPDACIEQIVVFRLTSAEAKALQEAGFKTCEIVCDLPKPCPGQGIEFKCVIVIDNQALLVFEIENNTEELVLVRSALCPIIGQDNKC